ncbi:FAD-dependent oxidoreductase [Aeromicrobium sp. CF4.19]|uniref:FAD-dependent oxidoreductase n=1 Tax=Aeromicrobium sp. CF4.19 TaxID=3373082 RepID=UPI003EE69C2E
MRTLVTRVDAMLGRVTMYRLVTILLLALTAVMVAQTAAGVFVEPFTVPGQLATLAVLLVASVVSNAVLGRLVRVRTHTESAVITALLLFMLFWPTAEMVDLAWLAGVAVLANASKYVIAWRGRHLLNPTAAGAFLAVVLQSLVGREAPINATWWIASEQMLPFVGVGALLVLWRTRRLDVGVLFIVVAAALVVWGLAAGQPVGDALRTTATAYPILFLAGFMLSEPLTLPPRRWQQLTVAGVTGVVFALPVALPRLGVVLPDLGVLTITPELALLIGNLLAFALAPRTGIGLEVVGVRPIGGDVQEVTFAPRRRVAFRAGQYLELHVPHRSDLRGTRRVFSISSPPSASDLTVALRVPEPGSSLKRELVGLGPGARIRATGVHGDFLWPRGDSPLLLVAGGIGVTPFLSQLREHGSDGGGGRDVLLVYGVADGDDVPYRDELVASGVRVVLVSPEPPGSLPAEWEHVPATVLSSDVVVGAAPDAGQRTALVSGPPVMVDAVRTALRPHCRRVRTDHFTGY